jgi:tetratricopeptide (TPR) repeat protein
MIRAALLLSLNLAQQQPPQDWHRRDAVLRCAVERAENAHPSDLHRLDTALLDLAQFLKDRGRYFEAEPLYLRSTGINETLYGPSSVEAAQSLLHLGAVYHAEFRLEEAEAAARKAVDLFTALAGADSPAFAYAAANLAVILADEGQPARAEPTLRRALSIIRQHPGSEAAATETLIEENLAMVYLRQGEYRKAEPLFKDVLRKFELSDDPARANTLAALAELAIGERRWTDAETHLCRAYKIVVDRQGDDHPWLIGILHLKAAVDAHFGDFRQASTDLTRSIELLKAAAGPDSPRLPILLDDRAILLRHLGRKPEARADLERAKAIRAALRKP